MRRNVQRIVFAFAVGAVACVWSVQSAQELSAQKAPVTVTRMYTGPDGLTHFEETSLPFAMPMNAVGTSFRRSPGPQKSGGPEARGFEFHSGPNKRYVVTLSGRAEIEGSGGGRFIADTNHILLVEDLTGKGHRYVNHPLGNEDWVVMFVELERPKATNERTN